MIAPHHKTESSGCQPIKFTLPQDSILTKLVVLHIREGHRVLTQKKKTQPILFVTPRSGSQFGDSTLCQYWDSLLKRTAPFRHVTITSLRSAFVESYTAAYGVPEHEWEGAAAVMGNSVAQWHATYAPTLKQRRGQAAVDSYAAFTARVKAEHH